MQIQLKQAEIVSALKQYIARQGINLEGKDVEISFTAGRKESGITADISIEDVKIPFGDEPRAEAKPAGPVLTLASVSATNQAPVETAEETPVKPVNQPADEPVEAAAPVKESAKVKTTSLFG